MRSKSYLMSLVLCGAAGSTSFAGDLPSGFTLGRYIPADSWMFINVVSTPETAWVDAQIGEVFDAVKASGIDGDIISLVLSLLESEEDRVELRSRIDKFTQLVKAVRWRDLFAEEFAFGERITSELPGYEYILVARGSKESAAANAQAIGAILTEITSLADELTVSHDTIYGIERYALAILNSDAHTHSHSARTPIVKVFRKDDLIVIALGPGESRETLDLLAGRSKKGSVIDLPRFKGAIGGIRAPKTMLMFFDAKALMHQVHRLFSQIIEKGHGDPQETGKIKRALEGALELADIVDYSITTAEMDGRRQLMHTVTRIQEDKLNSAVAKAMLVRRDFKQFDRFIPKDATGFNLDATADFGQLYAVVVDFVQQSIPDGPAHIAKWNEFLATLGFDPQRDLFSWLSGETISVKMPAAVVTPMGGADWVQMVRVKDSELANSKVSALIDFGKRKLGSMGQMLIVTPAKVNGEGFREVTHPMLMMAMRPVIGVKDEWLIIGSSAAAINKCLSVAAGEAPSIMQNDRFRKEGLIPNGPVATASFSDMSMLGNELSVGLGMAGMVAGIVGASIPDEPETKKPKAILQSLVSIVMKIGPILQKLDFYSSNSTVTTRSGAVIRSENVVTYKGPPSKNDKKTAAKPE